jgi:hypothetical protein
MLAAVSSSPRLALNYVVAGAVALLAGAAAAALGAASRWGTSPGRRALIHWTPIAITVLGARIMGFLHPDDRVYSDVAIGIIFGTSVAVMSGAVGALCTIAPVGPAPARWKRLWPFTLAAGLIVFVCGFNGLLTWKHAMALAIEGLVVLSLWHDPAYQHDWSGVAVAGAADPAAPLVPQTLAAVAVLASVLLAGTGAWLAVKGAVQINHLGSRISAGALAASLLSLVLVSPIMQGGRQLALQGASWVPMTAQVGVVLLNLCVLLPLIAIVPYASALASAVHDQHRLWIDWSAVTPQATIFPLAVWRIDTVVLVILAVFQLPVAVGKWNLGREEGMLLIGGYCAYLVAVTLAGM